MSQVHPEPVAQPVAAPAGLEVPGQAYMGVVPGKQYTPAPVGTSENAKENSIEPFNCFQHDLLPGETVIKTYDVHMPNILITKWQLYLYSILTFGLFYLYWACKMWCLRKGYCTLPNITMQRGMMAVTSTGRVLVWKTDFNQVKMGKTCFLWKICCGKKCNDPINWESSTLTRTYQLKNINEVSLKLGQVKSVLCGICCCSELYESSVRVRFGEYIMEKASWSAPFQTMPSSFYKNLVQIWFSSSAIDLFALALSLVNLYMPSPLDVDWVDIVSERQDEMVKDIENPDFKDSFAGLSDIHRTITQLITEKRSPVWKKPTDTTNIQMPHPAEVTGQDNFATMDIVKDDSCAVPPAYVPLTAGEEVIATSGNVYFITFMDKLKIVLCVIAIILLITLISGTGGFSAIFLWGPMLKIVEMLLDLRAKRQSRNGYILTTHRIINIAIWRKDTFLSICCPSALLCCFPTQEETVVRSLFPKKVESGIMKRFRRDLQGLILTDAGAIALNFDLTASTMAADIMNAESRISKRLAFLRAMCSVVSRTKVLDTSPVVDVQESQDNLEQKVLPKVDGETILARYAGKIYEDSCTDTCPNCCTTRSTWHPACCLKATCGVKPSFAKTAVIVSNMSVYALKADENDPCCKAGMCHALFKNNNWAIYWTHLSGLAGAEVASVLQGTETFWTRCCYGNWCGNNCCPMLKSRVQASLVIQNQTNPGAVTVQARDLNNFKSMRDTPEMVAFRQNLAQVQGILHQQNTME